MLGTDLIYTLKVVVMLFALQIVFRMLGDSCSFYLSTTRPTHKPFPYALSVQRLPAVPDLLRGMQ